MKFWAGAIHLFDQAIKSSKSIAVYIQRAAYQHMQDVPASLEPPAPSDSMSNTLRLASVLMHLIPI